MVCERLPSDGIQFNLDAVPALSCPSVGACPFETYGAKPSLLSSVHAQYHRRHSPAYEFQQVYILPLQNTESPPFGLVRTDSPLGTASSSSAVQLSAQATHPVDFTVLHKCLPESLPSQIRSCAIYIAIATPRTGFS
jgi:hypothetical protein